MEKAKRTLPAPLWVYAYQFAPPLAEEQFSAINALLAKEHSAARRAARTWTAKLVCEQRLTHILVVSDSPDQGRAVNRRLEGRLKRLQAAFSRTVPMVLADHEPAPPEGGAAPEPAG